MLGPPNSAAGPTSRLIQDHRWNRDWRRPNQQMAYRIRLNIERIGAAPHEEEGAQAGMQVEAPLARRNHRHPIAEHTDAAGFGRGSGQEPAISGRAGTAGGYGTGAAMALGNPAATGSALALDSVALEEAAIPAQHKKR